VIDDDPVTRLTARQLEIEGSTSSAARRRRGGVRRPKADHPDSSLRHHEAPAVTRRQLPANLTADRRPRTCPLLLSAKPDSEVQQAATGARRITHPLDPLERIDRRNAGDDPPHRYPRPVPATRTILTSACAARLVAGRHHSRSHPPGRAVQPAVAGPTVRPGSGPAPLPGDRRPPPGAGRPIATSPDVGPAGGTWPT